MLKKHFKDKCLLFVACSACLVAFSGSANAANSPFYDGAICQPPYTVDSATKLYEQAEKISKYELQGMAAIYQMSENIGADGFETKEVFFAGTSVGVLIKGLRADDLAKQYQLKAEDASFIGATKNYSRPLVDAQQPDKELGTVSIVARESESLPDKTVLMCEFVSHEDAKMMKELNK
ncbi:hypothetical protein LPW36_15940 [Jinshanibacter sp. LJY008]|uniref:Uncharacterized protein n=1 Tax=Limnobaculum eriocheiris TaxID=2897391 RepID=A0A9X1N161_9GAMM|nr:hypothetical protein [Limnobaculum eriocheiris]MCD1127467.1 hypothetical protein [Limnobaculum eriocheiris]